MLLKKDTQKLQELQETLANLTTVVESAVELSDKDNTCSSMVDTVTEIAPVLRKDIEDVLDAAKAANFRVASFIFVGAPGLKCPFVEKCREGSVCLLHIIPELRDKLRRVNISEEKCDPAEVWRKCKHNKEEIKDGRP